MLICFCLKVLSCISFSQHSALQLCKLPFPSLPLQGRSLVLCKIFLISLTWMRIWNWNMAPMKAKPQTALFILTKTFSPKRLNQAPPPSLSLWHTWPLCLCPLPALFLRCLQLTLSGQPGSKLPSCMPSIPPVPSCKPLPAELAAQIVKNVYKQCS